MGDDLDVDIGRSLALQKVGGGIRHVAAERLERVSFNMQSFDIAAFHVPDTGVLIESGLQDCNTHERTLSLSLYHIWHFMTFWRRPTFRWRRALKPV